jgi:hypothetical protein
MGPAEVQLLRQRACGAVAVDNPWLQVRLKHASQSLLWLMLHHIAPLDLHGANAVRVRMKCCSSNALLVLGMFALNIC